MIAHARDTRKHVSTQHASSGTRNATQRKRDARTRGDGAEALLPRRVPDLQLDPLAAQLDLADLEVDAVVVWLVVLRVWLFRV